MNSKWYWLIRQKYRNLKFQIKKAAFRLNERKESSERLSSFSRIVIRTLLVQVAINLVLVAVLYVGDKLLLSAMEIFAKTQTDPLIAALSESILVDIVIGGIGVAGVILGLYCSNMTSVYSSKYTNASMALTSLNTFFPKLEALHFEPTVVWDECHLKQFLTRRKEIEKRFPPYLVVSFYLKDLGFKKTYFRQLLNKFSRFDTLGTTNLALDKSLEGIYNFTEHQKQLEFQFLNCTRKIFWNGRNYSNQHLSESYLLYRAAYADMLQYRFLDYMLQKLNNGFEPLRQEFGFVGRIITPLPRINYSQHLAEYHDGKINASQLGDVILKKNLRN